MILKTALPFVIDSSPRKGVFSITAGLMIFKIRCELPGLALRGLDPSVRSTNREEPDICGRGNGWGATRRVFCLSQTHGVLGGGGRKASGWLSLSQTERVPSSPLQSPFSMHTGSGGEGGVWCQSEVPVSAANDIESAFRTENPEL